MHLPAPVSAARLIVNSHDLAWDEPSGTGDERDYWVDPEDLFSLIETCEALGEDHDLTIQLTSDDGFASDYHIYLPWLIATGRTATFFVCVNYIDQPNRITKAHIREMAGLGMSIGCHGMNHLRWTELNEQALGKEIIDAKNHLEDMLGMPVNRVAPPYGAYDSGVVRMCIKAGFEEIYSTKGGFSVPAGRLRPRVTVTSDPVRQADLIDLARRGPGMTDRLTSFAREVQAVVT